MAAALSSRPEGPSNQEHPYAYDEESLLMLGTRERKGRENSIDLELSAANRRVLQLELQVKGLQESSAENMIKRRTLKESLCWFIFRSSMWAILFAFCGIVALGAWPDLQGAYLKGIFIAYLVWIVAGSITIYVRQRLDKGDDILESAEALE